MFPQKSPIRVPLLIIMLITSLFAFAYHSENKITGMASKEVTGSMVKVSGAYDVNWLQLQEIIATAKKSGDNKFTATIDDKQHEFLSDEGRIMIITSGSNSERLFLYEGAGDTPDPININKNVYTYGKEEIGFGLESIKELIEPTSSTPTSTTTTPTGTQTITTTPTYDYKVIINGQTVIQEDVALDETAFKNFAKSQGWAYVGKATTQEVTSQTGNEYRVTQGSTTFLVKGDSLQSVQNIYPTAKVEESSYKITYNGQSIIVPYSQKEQEIVVLKALGVSYTATPVTGIEAASAQESKNYEIKLADGTTVNKMFADDNAAQQFIDSIENSLIGYGATYTRKISDEEAKKYGYANSGYTSIDGKVLFTKDGRYYSLSPDGKGDQVTDTKVLKTLTKIKEVTVFEIYEINNDGEISSESTGRRITKGSQYIDISEETYEELGLSEGDQITISTGILTRIDSKGYTTTVTKEVNEEKTITQEGDIKTTIIYDTQSKNKKTITYNSKSKTTREQIVSADGNTLTMNYKGSEFQSGTFKTSETSDGRTIELENKATAEAAKEFGNQIIDALFLIRETDGTFNWDMNDKYWDFKDGQLITDQGTTVRKMRENEGLAGDGLTTITGDKLEKGNLVAIKKSGVVYAKTENGYIYWAGDGVIIKDGTIIINPNEGYSITQEFPLGGTIGKGEHTIELKKGTDAYVRTDKGMLGQADGTYVYIYGELAGVVIQDGSHKGEAYKIDDLFNEDGKWKDDTLLGDSGAEFMKNQFTQKWSLEALKKSGLWGILGRRLKSGYDAARGGRALSTLLGCEDDNFCSDWRRKMDNFFANNVLGQIISGRWEDSLCHSQIPKDKSGVLNFNLPGNIIGVGAHVGAERTTTTYPNGTQIHLYTISYGINNPKFEEPGKSQKLRYNILLYGERNIKVFKQDREIGEGEIIRGTGTNPAAIPPKYSPYLYTRVCLKFSKKVETASGKYKDEVCNTISSYQGPSTIYPQAKTTTTTPSGTGTAEEEEFNDF